MPDATKFAVQIKRGEKWASVHKADSADDAMQASKNILKRKDLSFSELRVIAGREDGGKLRWSEIYRKKNNIFSRYNWKLAIGFAASVLIFIFAVSRFVENPADDAKAVGVPTAQRSEAKEIEKSVGTNVPAKPNPSREPPASSSSAPAVTSPASDVDFESRIIARNQIIRSDLFLRIKNDLCPSTPDAQRSCLLGMNFLYCSDIFNGAKAAIDVSHAGSREMAEQMQGIYRKSTELALKQVISVDQFKKMMGLINDGTMSMMSDNDGSISGRYAAIAIKTETAYCNERALPYAKSMDAARQGAELERRRELDPTYVPDGSLNSQDYDQSVGKIYGAMGIILTRINSAWGQNYSHIGTISSIKNNMSICKAQMDALVNMPSDLSYSRGAWNTCVNAYDTIKETLSKDGIQIP